MKPFNIFLSHCAGNEGPDKAIIEQFYDLLCEAFKREQVEKRTLVIEFDGQTPELAGNPLRHGLVKRIECSDLVICCFFPRYLEAHYFREEVVAALDKRKPMIEVRFIPPDDKNPYRHVERLDPRLVEEEGGGRPRCVVITIPYDGSAVERVREEIRRHMAVGQLVDAIRKQILERAERDLTMYSTADEVIRDLASRKTTSLRLFLYDGGTTIRRLQGHPDFQNLLDEQRGRLELDFLYVDTACKKFIDETPEYKGSAALQAMDDGAYSALYEALCRSSDLVHNQSPHGHLADVARSKKTLQVLKDKYQLQVNIRKTCQLPIYRLIISQHYVYYTHMLPQRMIDREQGSPDYFSLRLSRESSAGMTLIDHYDSLWKSGTPDPPDA